MFKNQEVEGSDVFFYFKINATLRNGARSIEFTNMLEAEFEGGIPDNLETKTFLEIQSQYVTAISDKKIPLSEVPMDIFFGDIIITPIEPAEYFDHIERNGSFKQILGLDECK